MFELWTWMISKNRSSVHLLQCLRPKLSSKRLAIFLVSAKVHLMPGIGPVFTIIWSNVRVHVQEKLLSRNTTNTLVK